MNIQDMMQEIEILVDRGDYDKAKTYAGEFIDKVRTATKLARRVEKRSAVEEAVVAEFKRTAGWLTRGAVQTSIQMSKNAVAKAISALLRAGVIESPDAEGTPSRRYRLKGQK